MKKTKKALASLAIAGMVLSMAPMSVFAADATATDRIFGADRIETAVKVAQAGWTTAATVIVAPAADANLVDALAAAPLAGQEKAPILLTDGAMLDAKTKQAIVDLKATKVYAVGALSAQVVMDLQGISGVTVEALKGADRIETATKIVAKLSAPAGSFVVGYNALADALSVASYAAANNYSILVANPDGSLPTTETAVGTKYVVGGPTLVADVAGATRLAGNDRFETNQKVLAALTYSYSKAYVANGEDAHLVDSLVASSLAATDKAAIVLGDTMSAKAAADVSAKLTADSQVIALGGTSVVPDSVKNSVKHVVPADLAVASVSSPNAKTLEIKFNKAVDEDTVIDFQSSDDDSDDVLQADVVTVTALGDTDELTSLDEAKASLSSDLTTLTLILPLDNSEIFDGDYVVAVSKDIEDADGNDLTKYSAIHDFEDAVRPTIGGPSYPTNNTAKFTFSEPIDASLADLEDALTLKDEDGDSADVDVDLADDHKSFELTTAALDEDVTYTLRVIGLADYANNLITPNPKTFEVVKKEADDVKPTVSSILAVKDSGIKVAFSEAIDEDVDFAVYVDGSAVDVTEFDFNDDGDEVELTFDSPVTEGLHTIKLVDYQDLSGNVGKAYSKIVKFATDDVAPTVVSTAVKTIDDVRYIVVEYDEEIALGTVPGVVYATYIEDSIEKDIEFASSAFSINEDDDSLLIDTEDYDGEGSNLPEGAYSIKLTSGIVEDTDSNLAAAKTVKVTIGSASDSDKTDPEVDGDVVVVDNDTIKVYYSEDMDTASALDVSNYTIEGDRVFESAVFVGDKTVVKLTIKDGAIKDTGKRLLEIKDVEDEAGNPIDDYDETVSFKENVNPIFDSVAITSINEVELTFSEDLDATTVAEGDFTVTIDGNEVSVTDVSVDEDVVTLTLGSSIGSLDDVVKVKLAKSAVKDLAGNSNAAETTVTAE